MLLPDCTLFLLGGLPLLIFEERYRLMLAEAPVSLLVSLSKARSSRSPGQPILHEIRHLTDAAGIFPTVRQAVEVAAAD